jgi:cytosine/adenosine deaminase-related metal-dependent hydrolase
MAPDLVLRARWVLPAVSPPLCEGAVRVQGGVVTAVGPSEELVSAAPGAAVRDLGEAILLPGLVNAHTHLSLTDLASGTPRPAPLLDWLGRISREAAALPEEAVRASVRRGLDASWRLGTVAVGEVTTRADAVSEIEADGRFFARIYFEFLGVSAGRARRRYEAAVGGALALLDRGGARGPVRPGLSPHAPYSVWPSLWKEAANLCRARDLRWSSHIAESPYEQEFLRHGRGPLREHLERLGVWDDAYPTPGTGIIGLWEAGNVLDTRALLVHALHLEPGEVDAIAAKGAFVCLCPRSNAGFDLPPPPVADLYARGVPLCLGTDSLASNEDLGVWGEMRAIRRLAPGLSGAEILRMATVNGARALGLDDLCGALRPGMPARLIAVTATDLGSADPVEYLLREPVEDRVRPVHAEP